MDESRIMDYYDDLYKRAESWLKEATGINGLVRSGLPKNLDLLLQELIIHRVELEMQNEELRESQSRTDSSLRKYKDFFMNAPVGMLELDTKGRTLEINDTLLQMLNSGSQGDIYKPFFSFIANSDRGKFHSFLNSVFKYDNKDACRLTLRRKNNSRLEVIIKAAKMEKLTGKTCILTVNPAYENNGLTDDQDEARAQASLESNSYDPMETPSVNGELDKEERTPGPESESTGYQAAFQAGGKSNQEKRNELDTILSILAHDLQSPAVNIEKLSIILLKRYEKLVVASDSGMIQVIIDEAARLRTLVSGLVSLSRIATSPGLLEMVDCNEVLQSALSTLDGQIKDSGAVITIERLPEIIADKVQIEILFKNLIANAIKYQRQGAVPGIHISNKSNDNEWIFSIRDNGIGIDAAHHQRIFRIFQRLHLQTEYEGTGVGLTICERIVQRHRGRIWVESEEGKGAVFCFTIPR